MVDLERWIKRSDDGWELTEEAADRVTVLTLVGAPEGVSEQAMDAVGKKVFGFFMDAIIASVTLEALGLGMFIQSGGPEDGEFMYRKLSDEQQRTAQKMIGAILKSRAPLVPEDIDS